VNSMLDAMGSVQVAATVRGDRVLLRGDGSMSHGISIAVDKDLQFSLGTPGDPPDEAVDFPYCLLEVASDSGEVSGDWLEELRSYGALRSVEGFSIGAHAVAALHKDEVRLPDWHQNFASMETSLPLETWGLKLEVRRGTITHASALATSSPKTAPADPQPPPATASISGPPVPALQEQSLEPKDFLASERTFLEWVSTTVMLAVMGIGLWRYSLSLGEAEPTEGGLLNATSPSAYSLGCYGLFMVIVALGFMWWAVFVHLSRVKAIQAGKAPESVFNNPDAPTLFAVAVCTTLVAQMAVKAVPLFTAVFVGSSGDDS